MTRPVTFDHTTLLLTGGGGFLGRQVTGDLLTLFPSRIATVGRRPALAEAAAAAGRPAEHHVERRCDLLDGAAWHDLLRESEYVLWMAALRDHSASTATAVWQNVAPLRCAPTPTPAPIQTIAIAPSRIMSCAPR